MFLLSVLDISLLSRENNIFLRTVDLNQSNILDCYLEYLLFSYSVEDSKGMHCFLSLCGLAFMTVEDLHPFSSCLPCANFFVTQNNSS